jgi:hypothetical protein
MPVPPSLQWISNGPIVSVTLGISLCWWTSSILLNCNLLILADVIHYFTFFKHISIQENSLRGNSLVGLDSTSSHFFEDLDSLDRLGSRSHDTVYVFYVRSGQKDSYEILSNMVNKQVHLLYCFIHLGNAIVSIFFFICSIKFFYYPELGLVSKSSFSGIFASFRLATR